MPGHEHVSYKGKLAELHLPFHPRSWHIRKCVWHGNPPPAQMDDGETVWFLKDTLRWGPSKTLMAILQHLRYRMHECEYMQYLINYGVGLSI